jgi:hypothetical protein
LNEWSTKRELLHGARHERILGIDVYALDDDPGVAMLQIAKVERALQLIARLDPRRFASIKRNVKRIVVSNHEGTHWNSAPRMIVMRWDWIYRRNAEWNALGLVHEATHARLDRRGIDHEYDLMPRIEALCLKEEIRFSSRLEDEYKLTADHLKRLDNPWWTPSKRIERTLAHIRALGVPRWFVWIVRRMAYWRNRKAIAQEGR